MITVPIGKVLFNLSLWIAVVKIYPFTYVGWIKMKAYSQNKFFQPIGLYFSVTENKFTVWKYSFSGPTGIYLFKYSKLKCKIYSKLTKKDQKSIWRYCKLWIDLTHCPSVVFFMLLFFVVADSEHVNGRWNTLLP